MSEMHHVRTSETGQPQMAAARPADVAIWTMRLDQPDTEIARLERLLDDHERDRVGSFAYADDQRRFMVAHGGLRLVLAHHLAGPPSLPLAIGRHGKPHVAVRGSRLEFSLAHAGELALIGVGDGIAVGVDLEPVRHLPDLAALAGHVLSPAEAATLARLPPDRHALAFFTFWTRKEAVLKACGLGLSVEPATITVGLHRYRMSDRRLGTWHVRNIEPAPGYVGAVAASDKFCCIVHQADAMLDPALPE
ncbi:MAG TPA: 4'-phosphopantetheinyl transferase superfamily protein [Geminicoccus sp.]|jgi:4'-phosphopantetheinyl transferase|uniref:4'-phosphopantetheinyl transferase family protein n=1 Tax=Geminicoccus sp. TaxID=2024832 RepID=UPI002E327930|nr:4'-phosphopantetheinyl transferase superfamily protein [Geminicoccus sp.]HEX2524917.1 4'-phosphopantetheinyl transferase superfamily protein [Geminicoccus sp.]